MLAFYLIAAHLVGDFVLQTRWQAAGKLDDPWIRMRHVDAYIVPFLPLVVWRCWGNGEGWHAGRGAAFMVALYVLHFATDSRRFHSTLGDWVVWHVGKRCGYCGGSGGWARNQDGEVRFTNALALAAGEQWIQCPCCRGSRHLEPNPWPPIPILIDQALHICQLAILGALFLS